MLLGSIYAPAKEPGATVAMTAYFFSAATATGLAADTRLPRSQAIRADFEQSQIQL